MKKLKSFIVSFFIIFSLCFVLSGCVTPNTPAEEQNHTGKSSKVRVYDVPDGVDKYDGAEIHIGQTEVPAYKVMINTSQNWVGDNYQRAANGVCLFELDGKAQVTVKPDVQINYSSVIRPLSAKITPVANVADNTLTFTFKSAGEYVLEINGDIHNAIHFFVSDYDTSAGVEEYKGYDNVIVFDAGLHTVQNDSRITSDNHLIDIDNNTLVYLADGAVVRGRFYENNLNNIAIVGRGILDGSAFERTTTHGDIVTIPIEFNYCKNILLKDFSILDPAGWAITNYFSSDSKIDNVKIISSRSNGDGISIQSCKDVEVEGCFIRSWDDSIVIKNYPRWDDRTVFGATKNITFKNCSIWTDLAQSMELGYETLGTQFEDVTFENITVLHAMHKAVISIHNANNADIKNVTFKNITIEDGKNAADGVGLIDLQVLYSGEWSSKFATTALGSINTVTIENVNVISAKKFTAIMGGCKDTRVGFESEHYVDNVTIKNVALAGTRPTQTQCKLTVTDSKYLRNFSFVQEEDKGVTGASFVFTQTDEHLATFTGGCSVEVK